MKHFALIFLLVSLPAFATKITYHKGKTDFVAEYDGKTLSYMSHALKHVFIIDECNRKMLENFWKRFLKNAERFPRATSLPHESRGYVQIDNEYRLILPLVKNNLANTEQEILILRSRDKKQCKR